MNGTGSAQAPVSGAFGAGWSEAAVVGAATAEHGHAGASGARDGGEGWWNRGETPEELHSASIRRAMRHGEEPR